MTYQVIDVTVMADQADYEQLGTKKKFWVTGEKWGEKGSLFKYSRANTGEHWSEKCAAEICRVLDIPHAEYEIAQCAGEWGVISRNFVSNDDNLLMGNQLLEKYDIGYAVPTCDKPTVSDKYTISEVLGCLDFYERKSDIQWSGPSGQELFCYYLLLDVIVGNQDRHHENWAILEDARNKVRRMAPTYDHASSMGRELSDEKRKERLTTKDRGYAVRAFAERAKTPFRDENTTKKLTTIEALLRVLSAKPSFRSPCLQKIECLTRPVIEEVFLNVPSCCISEVAREFAIRLVQENIQRIKENV